MRNRRLHLDVPAPPPRPPPLRSRHRGPRTDRQFMLPTNCLRPCSCRDMRSTLLQSRIKPPTSRIQQLHDVWFRWQLRSQPAALARGFCSAVLHLQARRSDGAAASQNFVFICGHVQPTPVDWSHDNCSSAEPRLRPNLGIQLRPFTPCAILVPGWEAVNRAG